MESAGPADPLNWFDKRKTGIGAKEWVKVSGWPMGFSRCERALGARCRCLVTRGIRMAVFGQVVDSVDRIGYAAWRLAIVCT